MNFPISKACLETIVACVESSFPDWDILFLSEADSFQSSSFEILHPKFQIFRHWPGEGSRSMSFVVRGCLRSLSSAVRVRSRVLSLEMWTDQRRDSTSLLILGVHGPHEDIITWHDFCSDFMDLVGSRKFRGPLVMAGDWNCDFGPTFSHYPGRERENNDMRDRRELLETLCAANELEFSFVDFISGLPRNHLHHAQCMQFPFTRVPTSSSKHVADR